MIMALLLAATLDTPLLTYAVPPCRLIDSRTIDQPLTDGATNYHFLRHRCGIPWEAEALLITVAESTLRVAAIWWSTPTPSRDRKWPR
jgi:hypothetical protein